MDLNKFFVKSELIPAIVVESSNSQVLLLAYMNKKVYRKLWKRGILGFTAALDKSFGIKVQLPVICKRLFGLSAIVILTPYW